MAVFEDVEAAEMASIDWTLLDAAKHLVEVDTRDAALWERNWALAKLREAVEPGRERRPAEYAASVANTERNHVPSAADQTGGSFFTVENARRVDAKQHELVTTLQALRTAEADSAGWTLTDAAQHVLSLSTRHARFWENEWSLAKLQQTLEDAESATDATAPMTADAERTHWRS